MNSVSVAHQARGAEAEADVARHLVRLERLSYLLDQRYLDPLLGLFLPGVGDALGSLLGLYGVWVARKMRAHPAVIGRMLIHLALDALIGSIPLAGAVGDFFFRAHLRNLSLLKARRDTRVRAVDYLFVALATLAFASALLLPVLLAVWLAWMLSRLWG